MSRYQFIGKLFKLILVTAALSLAAAGLVITPTPAISNQPGWEPGPAVTASSGVSGPIPLFGEVSLESLPQMTAEEAKAHPPIPSPRIPYGEEQYRAKKAQAAKKVPGAAAPVGAAPAEPPDLNSDRMQTPGSTKNIEGTDQLFSNLIPSDHGIAVGPTHMLQVVNSAIRVMDKKGVLLTGYPKSLNAFLGLPTDAFTFDPRTLFDWYGQRYVVICDQWDAAANKGYIWVAASSSKDLTTAVWRKYKMTVPTSVTGDFPDFPTLGLDREIIYVGVNVFKADGINFDNVVMYLPKWKIFNGEGFSYNFGFNFYLGGVKLDTMQPAYAINRNENPRAGFMVQTLNFNFGGGGCVNGCNGLVVWAVSNALVATGSPGVQQSGFLVPTANTYYFPPNALQKGCTSNTAPCAIDTGDVRIPGQVTYSGGTLWGAFTTRRTNGQATMIWFELRPYLNDGAAACTGAFANKCAQITGADLLNEDCYYCGGRGNSASDYFGTIMPDSEGNATMVVSYSDLDYYPSMAYISRRATQAKNTLHDGGVFQVIGQQFYQRIDSQGRNRWGDYTAMAPDFTDINQTYLWFAAQYSKTYPSSSGIWATRIGRNAFAARNQP